ncbi:TPA: polysaccharide biosynthesis protein [Pseudomonas aeruginosa]|nr:polysaccharide biosynthesis protein [Pseudomonas aeruginosa]HCF9553968.1 polysaccharide biosynthesis protein [Pseudomonas aeruginosa]
MLDNLRIKLLGLPRRYKRMLQVAADVTLVWLSLWLAFLVRLGTEDMISPFSGHAWLFIAAPLVAIPLFIRFGMYRAVMRYLGNDALIAIAKAVTISALVLSLLVYWYRSPPAPVPRSLVFNYWWLSMLLIGGLRLAMRQYFMGDWYSAVQSVPFLNRQDGLPRVAIYGAGAAGNQLVAALRLGRAMRPVAFIDDDKQIANRVIAGLRVYTAKHIRQMIDETGAQEVLLAIPSATRARRREILESLEPFPLHVRSMPGFMDLASGRVKVDDLQEVDIADLLGRDSVAPRKELLERCIRGQVVMVTGAGGSIGSELCRQIMSCSPSVLILFEHSEYNLYSIHQELERRIKRGGPVTVTHPSITRYFMTIPEAAQLVIQAGSMGQGGDVFVLDMGPPVKILELAEKMIHLSGLSVRSERSPHGDIAIEFSGLRPGEKLYEELLIGDNVNPTDHPMIMRANEEHLSWEAFKVVLEQLLAAVEKDDYSRVRQLLRETVSGYAPDGEIVDWIYRQRRREP